MPAKEPVQHWKKVLTKKEQSQLPQNSIQEWQMLPVRITPQDVITIPLTAKETASIANYGESYLDKSGKDTWPSSWDKAKGQYKRNPNVVGIRGEYAGLKFFCESAGVPCFLSEFLYDRPFHMADMGDCIIRGRHAKVFDYKTRTRLASIEQMISSPLADTYMAEMDTKFATEKYSYLNAFIFCVNNEREQVIHLMGWMSAEEYFEKAQRIPKGDPVPQYRKAYDIDILVLPYRRLRPMQELLEMEYYPITHDTTLLMREHWQQDRRGWDAYKYIAQLQAL